MPLYKAKILVSKIVDIPVYARSEEEARRYMAGTEEWKDDCGLDDFKKEEMSFSGCIEKANSPKETDFDGDCLCWNHETMNVAQAFYDAEFPCRQNASREYDAEYEAEIEKYYSGQNELIRRFDAARKEPDAL